MGQGRVPSGGPSVRHRITVGADKAYDTQESVQSLRTLKGEGGYKKRCPVPCSGAAAHPCAWTWPAGSGVRGGGPPGVGTADRGGERGRSEGT
jgi:hypothetical protein